jgi:bifunctional non-homologous end joining protein LigD
MALPEHIEPMLATSGEPFDSPAHVFELKWDGVRAMAYAEHGTLRMHGRRRRDLAARYPELAFLAALPSGTVLDGELVVLQPGGRPDFGAIVGRENMAPARALVAAAQRPVHYVVFDLLYRGGENWMTRPFAERRAALAELLAAIASPRLLTSDGVAAHGRALFAAAQQQALEGIVGKRLDAPYRPGERGDAWIKIKLQQQVHCLILGFEPDEIGDVRSVIVASDFGGELRCVGKVGSGLTVAQRAELRRLLTARRASRPLVDAGMAGQWVEPGLYCTVRFLERTESGSLRAPVFVGLVPEGAA